MRFAIVTDRIASLIAAMRRELLGEPDWWRQRGTRKWCPFVCTELSARLCALPSSRSFCSTAREGSKLAGAAELRWSAAPEAELIVDGRSLVADS